MERIKTYLSQHKFLSIIIIAAALVILLDLYNLLSSVPGTTTFGGGSNTSSFTDSTTKEGYDMGTSNTGSSDAMPQTATESTGTTDESTSSPDSRLIIKSGSFSIRVDDVKQGVSDVSSLAETLGGFVTSSTIGSNQPIYYYETYDTSTPTSATVVIRVPADRFDEAITHIKSIATKVFSERVTGQDVTEDYTDLASQLKNYQEEEARLQELFTRSGSVEDILKVERELSRVRGLIETTQGRMKYLENSAKLSSITVTLTEKEVEPVIEDDEWTPMTAIREAVSDLITFAQNSVDAVAYFVIRWGLFIAAAYFAWKWYQKRQNTSPAPPTK